MPLASTSVSFPPSDISSDIAILSTDNVLFYAHSCMIPAGIKTNFNSVSNNPSELKGTMKSVPIFGLPEPSDVINVVLHALYNKSCAEFDLSDTTLARVVEFLATNHVPLDTLLSPATYLHQLFLERARNSPLLFYSLAAKHDLYNLASPISSLLLAHSVMDISDDYAQMMGPRYLKRLIMLHCHRMQELKRLLALPPSTHDGTKSCTVEQQQAMVRAWAFTSAHIVMYEGPSGCQTR